MLKLPQKVKIKWSPFGRKIYEPKGYLFTKYYEEFEINVLDLSAKSNAYVELICDYCGETFKKRYGHYTNMKEKCINTKDCCEKCKGIKAVESNMQKYNGMPMQIDKFKENYKNNSLEKYGREHPMQSDLVKEIIKVKNNDKYGVNSILQLDEVIEKKKKYYV